MSRRTRQKKRVRSRRKDREQADQSVDAFHAHLDQCPQCRDQPFNLCAVGAMLLSGAARS